MDAVKPGWEGFSERASSTIESILSTRGLAYEKRLVPSPNDDYVSYALEHIRVRKIEVYPDQVNLVFERDGYRAFERWDYDSVEEHVQDVATTLASQLER